MEAAEGDVGEYTDIAGLPTWYEAAGEGDPLVLLHGGLCTNETWAAQIPAFAERYRVLAPERRAHGHTPDVDGPLTYDDMASDTIGFLQTVVQGPAHLVGWSDGGVVGLLVAISRPDLVRKLVPISANFDAAGGVPDAEGIFGDADAPGLETLRGPYAASSPDGAAHWPVVFAKFIEMVSTQPHISPADLGRIQAPTLIISSDDDLVSLEHTIELYRSIAGAELAVLPGTSHALVFEEADLLNGIVLDFLGTDAKPTLLPVHRAR